MFGSLGRRAVEAVVGLFALLGFAYVPLGSKSGLEHSVALLRTAPAREAAAGLVNALHKARELVVRTLADTRSDTTPLPLPSSRRGAPLPVRPLVPRLPSGQQGRAAEPSR